MKLGVSSIILGASIGAVYGFLPTIAPWHCKPMSKNPQAQESRSIMQPQRRDTALFVAPVLEERPKRAIDHVLIEDSAGHTINCTVNAFMNLDGKRYCVATPIDSVMILMDRNGNLIDPADEIVERMYNQLDNYFTDRGFEILHTAGFLTVTGLPDWAADEDVDDEEDTDDEDDEEEFLRDEDEGPEIEEGSLRADPIVDVEFEGVMFKVAQLLDKIPLSAVQDGEGGRWALVSDGALYDQLTDAMH